MMFLRSNSNIELFDSFEPYDQTRLEMSWGRMADKTGKTLGKMTGKTPERILALLVTTPTLTIPEIANRLEKSSSAIERAIRKLRESGRLKRIGSAKTGHWQILDD
jgi:ATP-dependent DNA helicase RecG